MTTEEISDDILAESFYSGLAIGNLTLLEETSIDGEASWYCLVNRRHIQSLSMLDIIARFRQKTLLKVCPATTMDMPGASDLTEYRAWRAMWSRCTNPDSPKFEHYGARGILVCDRWKKFSNFLEDMGAKPTPKHSLERVRNNDGYCPNNCKWATMKEQANNRRTRQEVLDERRKRSQSGVQVAVRD